MPFKSKAQQRMFFAAEDRGEIPAGTAKRWADHTPNIKKLPERVKKAYVQFPDTEVNPAYVGVPLQHEHVGMAYSIKKLEELYDECERNRKSKKGKSMNKLGHELYWMGVNKYLEKRANQSPQMQGYEMGYADPQRQETFYEKFVRTKRKHDPYFSLGAGGALGALAGSTKGKAMTAIGGGLGAIAGHHLAKKD